MGTIKKERLRGCQSPSKFISLECLYLIRVNYYCGYHDSKNRQINYEKSEVDDLIWVKESKNDAKNIKQFEKDQDEYQDFLDQKGDD